MPIGAKPIFFEEEIFLQHILALLHVNPQYEFYTALTLGCATGLKKEDK